MGVAVCVDTVQGMAQFALLIDYEGGALYRYFFVAVHFLVMEYAIFFAHLGFCVGQ